MSGTFDGTSGYTGEPNGDHIPDVNPMELIPDGAVWPNPPEDPWAHRSKGMKCRTCMWYVVKVDTRKSQDTEVGRCRRHAPTMDGYPVVYETDWCGDHKLDQEKI